MKRALEIDAKTVEMLENQKKMKNVQSFFSNQENYPMDLETNPLGAYRVLPALL
jgi:hypothetical protein